jgi:hypothetical protein
MEDEDSVGHTSRSSGLLCLEAGWARVSQFGLKTGGGMARMVHMASLRRLHRVKAEDGWVNVTGCIRPFYRNFDVFYVLCPKGILVFYVGL